MLTVDHVKLRRKKGVVEVVPLAGLDEARALELAACAFDVAVTHEGEPRAALEDALDELPAAPAESRFARALKKLVLDASDFDVDSALDPEALRAEVFAASARARAGGRFDRAAVLAEVAAGHDASPADVERALFADLASAHASRGLDVASAEDLLARARVGEVQAVLLRAVRVTLTVDATPLELRSLLRALKLHQLLFELDTSNDDVRIVVEGPMGLFQQSTRYGLKLALLVPHLSSMKRAVVEAEVRLRKGQGAERFVWRSERAAGAPVPAALGDVARALLEELAGHPRFEASEAAEVLRAGDGGAAVVPDLKLVDKESGEVVFVEVLGFWSRAALWKRVELVEAGFPFRVVFCASDRLRVSEQALPDDAPSALVVYKGVLRASRVIDAADRLTRDPYRRGRRPA